MDWRERLFIILEKDDENIACKIYGWAMVLLIVLSLVPLAFREHSSTLIWIDRITVTFFIIDYLLRWATADFRYPRRSRVQAFLLYPFTPFAIVDLLSILPSFSLFNRLFKLARVTRLLKILRVYRLLRFSDNMQILLKVLHKERRILFTVFVIAVSYILITALVMYNVEESAMFEDFFDAMYWATTTLTTVGYGDICPGTDIGRVISMLSAIMGVAVIALPSGVITASYLEELRKSEKKKEKEKEREKE